MFNAETGTSTGEVTGQSKALNNCDFRPSRPFRLVTASEDNSVAFFEGPPFKFKKTLNVSVVQSRVTSRVCVCLCDSARPILLLHHQLDRSVIEYVYR